MAAGESARELADSMAAAATRMRNRAERVDRAAQNYRAGEEGERRCSELLVQLAPDGFFTLDDRCLPEAKGNLDHLVVGPPGVFIVDSKNWSGTLAIEGRTLRQNGRRRDNAVEAVRSQAAGIAERLEDAGLRSDLRPVLCFVGEAQLADRSVLDPVHLVNADDLTPFLRSLPRVLSGADVDTRVAALLRILPRRRESERDGAAPPPAEAPTEMLVFLDSWRKAGRHRLYVKSSEGADVGYLDLLNGEVHPATDEWAPTLGRLLPHYVKGDTPGIAAADMSEAARGRLRRFLDSLLGRDDTQASAPPILAAYRWRGHGKNRLYLHRIDSSGLKATLGWFDLEGSRYRCEESNAAGVLSYCAQQYRALRGLSAD